MYLLVVVKCPLGVSICSCSAWYSAKDPRQIMYRFLNLCLYIGIFFRWYPALKILAAAIASSPDHCLLSLMRLLLGFRSLNCSQEHAQAENQSDPVANLICFLSLNDCSPMMPVTRCLKTAHLFCTVFQSFMRTEKVQQQLLF